MLSNLGQRLARVFRATAPDPFVLAILLTALTFALALAFTDSGGVSTGIYARTLLDAWQGGFWNLLGFAMQMCLILVTGHALASSPPVAALLRKLAALPRTGAQASLMTALVAICFGLVNWGLGLIVGALLARDTAKAMRDKGVAMPAGLLAAAGYTTMMVWHGGLSGSAPLAAASVAQQRAILGDDLGARVGAIPVSETIFTPFNLLVTGGLVVIIPLLFAMLAPRGAVAPATARVERPVVTQAAITDEDDSPGRFPSMLERSPAIVWIIALPALIWLATRFADRGVAALDLNTANLLFLSLGLALHGSARRYADAIDDAARGCAGIILQFPFYAGIIGLMTASGLAAQISSWFVAQSGGSTGGLSVMTFLSAGLVNLFVPSGGGQWGVQGPIAMQAALDAGVSPARLVLAVSYGDQWTNMLQPFWALPALAITGAKARDVVGYTALALVVGGAWIIGCLLLA